jgi:hypothetical protein
MCLRNINYETISHNENMQYYSMERQLPMLCRNDSISYHNKKFQNMKKNSRLLYETKYRMIHFKTNFSNILDNLNNE